MRPLRLAQIAVQAEGLRWRRRARRVLTQIVCVVIALPFVLAAFGFIEAALWIYVSSHLAPALAAIVAMGGNLLVVAVLGLMILIRGGEDRVSLEALEVRRRALESAQRSVTIAAIVGPVANVLVSQLRGRRRRD
ncbi:MAG TPA: hypothetical protein VFA03_12170 [Acetobacteraceae bacterium]|nr:hypothetical protein [Acetobacteraceae bacterium]